MPRPCPDNGCVPRFVEVPLGPQFAFAPEVLYTQKGAKAEFDGPEFGEFDGATFTNNLQQLRFPSCSKRTSPAAR